MLDVLCDWWPIYIVSSVSFSCPTPSHSIRNSVACFGAEVWSVTASMVSLLPVSPAQVCVAALDLPGLCDSSSSACISLSLYDSLSSRTVWSLLCAPSSTGFLSLRVAPAPSAAISAHEVAPALCPISPAFRLIEHSWWKWPVSWHL